MFLGMWESVREWPPTLPSELPFWELESRWIFKYSNRDCRGQNPLDWIILYIIGNLFKRRCLKWAPMTHLDTSNTSYGQKKGRESNCQIWPRALKVKNRPNFFMCRWCATHCWKALDEGYNFVSNLILIRGLHTKLWPFKVVGVPTLGISRLPIGSPRTKWHLGVGLVAMHIIYYKGEGGGFC